MEELHSLPENHVEVVSRAEWRQWLQNHHLQTTGIWLVTFKRASGDRYLCYEDIVGEALCFGWIDSKTSSVDSLRTKLGLAPSEPGSLRSRPNWQRVEQLIETGLMVISGLTAIDRAKADGTWSALDDVENLVIPQDLADALLAIPGSLNQFERFPRSVKRGILEWILQAKTPATRAKRIQETAALATIGKRAAHWSRKVP